MRRQKAVSRQRAWQEARRRQGLCISCGVNPLHTKNHCVKCSRKIREAARKRNHAKRRYRNSKSYQSAA